MARIHVHRVYGPQRIKTVKLTTLSYGNLLKLFDPRVREESSYLVPTTPNNPTHPVSLRLHYRIILEFRLILIWLKTTYACNGVTGSGNLFRLEWTSIVTSEHNIKFMHKPLTILPKVTWGCFQVTPQDVAVIQADISDDVTLLLNTYWEFLPIRHINNLLETVCI
jgi:hypothetical protein